MARGKKTLGQLDGSTDATGVPVATIEHPQAQRKNIPTRPLEEFARDDEAAPPTLRYPRDQVKDPQLVWRGKDAQDEAGLDVPVVPIYLQEAIEPRALIEDLRAQVRGERAESDGAQLGLFQTFAPKLSLEQRVEFYKHAQDWSNRMILGDSLLVMSSLAEKEDLRGKVQCIYFDPPYGIKFQSNWQVSTRKRDVKDGKVEDATRQPEQIKAFRDTWKDGIHSYLTYLRDRLTVARDLLTESGSIFVQIGDENVHVVRCLMDEVFGPENHIASITYTKTSSATAELLAATADYVLWYARAREVVKFRRLYVEKSVGGDGGGKYDQVRKADGTSRSITAQEKAQGSAEEGCRVFRLDNLTSQRIREGRTGYFEVKLEGRTILPGAGEWKTSRDGMLRLVRASRVAVTGNSASYVRYVDDFGAFPVTSVWTDIGGIQSRADPKVYVVQTSGTAIERCLLMTTDPGDIVLDPTCGSGTTAYVAEQWGRRWITIDTSRVALALARTRLIGGRFPYYLLADSHEGRNKAKEKYGEVAPATHPQNDIRQGFVYTKVPHVTLKSIANNEEIDTIHAKFAARLDPVREKLSLAAGHAPKSPAWEEWQVPREPGAAFSAEAKALHAEFWQLRRQRQAEIDASIARRAETETLYDQPFEDKARVRVTGPFTVESLSPHRIVSPDADEDRPQSVSDAQENAEKGGFVPLILEHLAKAGVQNTRKGERLTFERVDAFAHAHIHGVGRYRDAQGKALSAAIHIGPEHGTVGPDEVREAARAAVRSLDESFDLLVVCGFAFDPYVTESLREIGRLPIVVARINPDLLMGDLLKNTGAGNLFTVFGEPDVEITKTPDGRFTVNIRGVDLYDPNTGAVRNASADELACWFIDTDYDQQCFIVRHAYFTGADEPFEKLQRALKSEIDPAAWQQLYSTQSRPFAAPKTGHIAVKVINHYGDEVLRAYDLRGQ